MELSLFLYSFLIPTLFGAGLLALAWMLPPFLRWVGKILREGRRRHSRLRNGLLVLRILVRKQRSWLQTAMFGIALGAGLFGSFYAESGLPVFPPPRSDDWIGWLGPLMVVVALAASLLVNNARVLRLELFGILLGAFVACLPLFAWMASSTSAPKSLFPGMSGADHAMLGFMIAFAAIIMVRLQEVREGALLPCLLALVFTTGSLTALASGWITMGILFGVVAAISGAGALIGRFSGTSRIGIGGAMAVVLLLVILPVATWCKTTPPDDLHWWFWLMIPGSLLLLLPCENRWFERLPAIVVFWLRVAIVALPLIYVLIKVVPMLVGGSSEGTDEFEDMMKLYE